MVIVTWLLTTITSFISVVKITTQLLTLGNLSEVKNMMFIVHHLLIQNQLITMVNTVSNIKQIVRALAQKKIFPRH